MIFKRSVVLFMYGKGVNVSDAVKCYRACNNMWKEVAETNTYNSYFQRAEPSGSIKCGEFLD